MKADDLEKLPAEAKQQKDSRTGECFDLTIDGAIAHLKMIRPDKHNSMIASFWWELPRAIEAIEQDPRVRVAVLSAEGKTFSSGMDLSVFQNGDLLATANTSQRDRLRRFVLQLQGVFSKIENCRVPLIAAVQGGCIGAALDLISACDLRYATVAAYFSIHEINLATMADLGTLQRLPRLMPEALVRELALTGDKLGADRSKHFGLVGEVFTDSVGMMKHVMSVAEKIAQRSPAAIAGTREALRYARSHSVEDSLEHAALWQAAMFSTNDVFAAVQAQKAGTNAEFADPLPAAKM